MKIYADGADLESIIALAHDPRISGFTTNPTLMRKAGVEDYEAFARKVLETIPFERNSDGFVFDSEFLAQSAWFGFRIGDAPIPCRYFDEASSIRLSAFVKSSSCHSWRRSRPALRRS